MDIIGWIGQVFLAVTFLYSGIMKSTRQREKLVSMGQTGVADLSYPAIRFIGTAELAGVLGILLPWYLQILPVLTPVTALCFALLMLFAMRIHYRRNEVRSVLINIGVFIVSLIVAYIRFSEL